MLAKELSPLRINAVSPGLTNTEAYIGMEPEARKQMLARTAENLPVKKQEVRMAWRRAIFS